MEITYRTGKYYTEENGTYHIVESHEDGVMIGELYADITTGQIMNLEVNEDRRGEGIARALYEYAETRFDIFHAPDEHCSPEGLLFKQAVGGETIAPELAYQP